MATQEEILAVIKKHPKGIRQSKVAEEFEIREFALNKQIAQLARKGLIARQILCETGRPYLLFPLKQQPTSPE